MEERVTDNSSRSRFELKIGDEVAFANYTVDGNRYLLTHVEVPPHLNGSGHGSALAKGLFEIIRERGKRAVPICPFLVHYIARHSEFADLTD